MVLPDSIISNPPKNDKEFIYVETERLANILIAKVNELNEQITKIPAEYTNNEM